MRKDSKVNAKTMGLGSLGETGHLHQGKWRSLVGDAEDLSSLSGAEEDGGLEPGEGIGFESSLKRETGKIWEEFLRIDCNMNAERKRAIRRVKSLLLFPSFTLGSQLRLFYHDLPCLPVIYWVEHSRW